MFVGSGEASVRRVPVVLPPAHVSLAARAVMFFVGGMLGVGGSVLGPGVFAGSLDVVVWRIAVVYFGPSGLVVVGAASDLVCGSFASS